MLQRLLKMPAAFSIILIWVVVWLLVVIKDAGPALWGKGISQVGGEYYRFVTAALTHTNFIHLFFNVCAMFWIGFLYEEHLGSIRFLLIAVLCAVISQVIFLCIYKNADQSFGGSVYVYALCGFGLTMQCLLPDFPKMQWGKWSGNWLVISLIAGNIPVLSFMNITTLFVHAISFGVGILAALLCKLLGMK